MQQNSANLPVLFTGWKGFKQNWKNDLVAGLSVALVALPLSLAIASSAGVPPVFGLVSVAIGGLVTTFVRGSHVAINGPGAGIVSAILGALLLLNDGSENVLGYVTAAIVVAGAIQVILGILKLGRLAEVFPSAVISGVLAAIGIIILINQLDDMLGFSYSSGAQTVLQKVSEIPHGLLNMNPLIAMIGVLGLVIMAFYPRVAKHGLRFIPAPIWVMIIGVLAVYFIGLDEPFSYSIGTSSFATGTDFLVQIPSNLEDMIMFPNFDRIGEPVFWLAVLPIFLIATIESLVSSKAVDKLDPFKRTTRLNRDLVGIGFSTVLSGLLGGLPVVTVIARSSVNINNLGRSRWSNFFQGTFILIFVLLLAPLIQMVPLSALGAILVFTGYKLAGPYVYKHTYQLGWEQLFFLLVTIITTLVYNLVTGLLVGMGVNLLYHMIVSRLPLHLFFGYIFKFPIQTQVKENGDYLIRIKGIANFITNLKIKNSLDLIPKGKNVVLQLSKTRLIDLTVMENLHEFARNYQREGGKFAMEGYEMHDSTSKHPTALRVIPTSPPKTLSRRQQQLKNLAAENGWTYRSEMDWDNSSLQNFLFFNHRPLEYKENVINGTFEDLDVRWEIADITFDEGALSATEVYHSTVEVMHLPFSLPTFTLEKEGKLDKVFDIVRRFVGRIDIDFEEYPDFSKHFLLEGPDEEAIRKLFRPSLLQFLQENEIYHIESAENKLLIFRKLRLSKTEEVSKMLIFCHDFVSLLEPVQAV